MSRLVSPPALAKLYRINPQSVTNDILPRVLDELDEGEVANFARDLVQRRPAGDKEARALMNCFYRLPPESRRTMAAMDMTFACEAIISKRDVTLVAH